MTNEKILDIMTEKILDLQIQVNNQEQYITELSKQLQRLNDIILKDI